MGQKIRPDSLRLGIIRDWNSRWFAVKNFGPKLQEDEVIRNVINTRIKLSGIVSVMIERNANNAYRVFIKAAKPGLVIGRGGQGIEELTKALQKAIQDLYRSRGIKNPKVPPLSLTVEELKRTEISAQFIGQSLAWDLEKRLPFRRAMKKAIENAMGNRDVQGIKVKMSGRLDGNEIARVEMLTRGKLPLQTLRANIDYGQATAYCTYGTIGIKVWVYKGLVFKNSVEKIKRNE